MKVGNCKTSENYSGKWKLYKNVKSWWGQDRPSTGYNLFKFSLSSNDGFNEYSRQVSAWNYSFLNYILIKPI